MSHPSAPPGAPALLAHTFVPSVGPSGARDLVMLHGIYGRGRNWAAIARALTTVRPDWRAVLVDLRGHGDSPAGTAPATVAETARDVGHLAARASLPVSVVLGHSFGGKVALACAEQMSELSQIWLIDSTPAAKVPDGSAWRMLEVIRNHPGPFSARQEAADLIEAAGFSRDVASWMASNVTWRDGQYVWRLDADLMEALLRDFFVRDYWHLIEKPPDRLTIHVVKGTQSSLLTPEACARIEAATRVHQRAHLHYVEGGHWLNSDNPQAVTELLARELPAKAP